MNEYCEWIPGTNVAVDNAVDQDFEVHLADSTRLALRVAYAVVRHREDAEDIAQEALTTAYRKLRMLRQPDRFRAWLVRITIDTLPEKLRMVTVLPGIEEHDIREVGLEPIVIPPLTPLAPEIEGGRL